MLNTENSSNDTTPRSCSNSVSARKSYNNNNKHQVNNNRKVIKGDFNTAVEVATRAWPMPTASFA